MEIVDTLVVGAGQAGLAISYYLQQMDRDHVVLEANRSFSSSISTDVLQLHSSQYRNPDQLPSGAVLVVGSGQSGCQIAEELLDAGREVYLATGRAGRVPRRYRGQDAVRWMRQTGFLDQTVDQLESSADRFRPNPHVSGKGGGRTLNLLTFHRRGIHLLGHAQDAQAWVIGFAPDLRENLAAADKFARQFKDMVDGFIDRQGLQIPDAGKPEPKSGYEAGIVTEINMAEEGINAIIWATGYRFDFSWVRFPIFDEFGYPIQERGVTPQPGLYFLGLHWLHTIESGLLSGVGADAAHVAAHFESRG